MISVIMASYLGDYHGAASNREEKLHRAIKSFLKQNIGELIIVADGCEKTSVIAKQYPLVRLVELSKQSHFSGNVRQQGILVANYSWICYLDSDDEFEDGHLLNIVNNIDNQYDWLYYNCIINGVHNNSSVNFTQIGTSNIAHKSTVIAQWPDGYNHDWNFIEQLGSNYKKIEGGGYIIHHVPGQFDN
jgi:glycosyltransferase involved in cell wall biosynthesis